MDDNYVWTRRAEESEPAYEAFRLYLGMGQQRVAKRVAEELGKSYTLIHNWSARHDWRERVQAYEIHIAAAETDGLVHQLSESRDKNLALMDKLRDHLSNRLDKFIQRDQDPSMLWTQALTAMAKVEQNSLLLGEKTLSKASEGVTRVEKLIERMEALAETEG